MNYNILYNNQKHLESVNFHRGRWFHKIRIIASISQW